MASDLDQTLEQITTDDENMLSLQSSPSPYASEEQEEPMDDEEQDNYLDPDLYCLRHEEIQDNSSDDDYGSPKQTKTRRNTRPSKTQRVSYETEEEEESMSSEEDWGSTKRKTRTKRLKQKSQRSFILGLGAISPSDFARHSTRARKVTNYNEDNAELWGLSEEEIVETYTPVPAEEDEGDVIEQVLDHRRKEGDEGGPDIPEKNLEFLIKWKSWSHLHDTWDTYEYLKTCKSF
ncbi:hypothetical protein CU098_013935, partial [Rhizopus stolonifer]